MYKQMAFKQVLEEMGFNVEVTQEDDGSGYECLEVRTDAGAFWEVTVTIK